MRLLALPGVGTYTARAVLAFGFGRRVPVVDTNVRRVLHRCVLGADDAGPATAADLRLMDELLPPDPATAARVCAATMELGALVCTATNPDCAHCPIAAGCRWYRAGSPGIGRAAEGPGVARNRPAAARTYPRDPPFDTRSVDGLRVTDRRCRQPQWARCLDSLLADGLVCRLPDGRYALPSD